MKERWTTVVTDIFASLIVGLLAVVLSIGSGFAVYAVGGGFSYVAVTSAILFLSFVFGAHLRGRL